MTNYTQQNDDQLVNLIQYDDEAAFRELFDRYYTLLTNIANRYVEDAHIAEDIAQDVFIKLWNRRKNLAIHFSFKQYICRAVVNTSINHLRQQKKLDIILSEDTDEEYFTRPNLTDDDQRAEQENLENKLLEAIQRLPERCRLVFTMHKIDGLSHKEVAEELGISTKTIENQITKAMKVLKEVFNTNSILVILVIFFIKFFIGA